MKFIIHAENEKYFFTLNDSENNVIMTGEKMPKKNVLNMINDFKMIVPNAQVVKV
jgi:hypothetical protein